eukprot:2464056-Rhodomonas_salina.5
MDSEHAQHTLLATRLGESLVIWGIRGNTTTPDEGSCYRSDLRSSNPTQAVSGLWSYRDHALVKYARGGSPRWEQRLSMRERADQSLMQRELVDKGACENVYHWRGDSVTQC